jgi:hypothetical protein
MGISLLSRRNIQILVTLIALIIFTSIIWRYEQSIANYQSRIHSLQGQLSAQKLANQQLIENLGITQATREATQAELQELIAMDWERKYADAMEKNESLHKKTTELKNQFDIDIARLQRAQSFLSKENNSMKEFNVRFEEVSHGYEQNIAELESEIEQQNKTIAKLESEIKQQKQSIASLQKPAVEKPMPEPSAVKPATDQVATGEDDNSGIYRHVRLQSLKNAMINQDSVARKNILISVIPTIPNGVSGDEFLSLVAGMKSEDVLAAIQLTNKYITRPLDSNTVSALTGKMNEKDAEAVSLILKQ